MAQPEGAQETGDARLEEPPASTDKRIASHSAAASSGKHAETTAKCTEHGELRAQSGNDEPYELRSTVIEEGDADAVANPRNLVAASHGKRATTATQKRARFAGDDLGGPDNRAADQLERHAARTSENATRLAQAPQAVSTRRRRRGAQSTASSAHNQGAMNPPSHRRRRRRPSARRCDGRRRRS